MTITLDGTTGITTPGLTNTGTETIATLSVSGAVTLSGGTANGVGYLNGSKVLTSGTALTFDGTSLGIGTSSPNQKLAVIAANPTNGYVAGLSNSQGTAGRTGTYLLFDASSLADYKIGIPADVNAFAIYDVLAASERMRIDSSGNLGIGTSSPGYKLEVNGASYLNGNILTQAGSTFYNSTGDLYIRAGTGGTLRLGANGSNSLITLSSGGNVVINAPSSGTALTVGGTGQFFVSNGASTTNQYFNIQNTGGSFFLGVESSAGGTLATGSAAYSSLLTTQGATSLHLGTNLTVRATIDSSGNVGVGATPTVGWGSNARVIQMAGTGSIFGQTNANIVSIMENAYWDNTYFRYIATDTYGAVKYTQYQGSHYWQNAGSGTAGGTMTLVTQMTLDASGNLLVGTTDNAGANTQGLEVYIGSGATRLYIGHVTGTANGTQYAVFNYAGTNQIGSITQSGTTGVLYNVTSDRRLKDNITDADSASDLIDAIKVRQFDWKSDGSHQRYGMIAQELHEVAPEAVHSPADPDDMMAVDYSKLVPMLVKEIQSLRVRLNALESK